MPDGAVFDLSFTERHRYRPYQLVAPAFVAECRARVGEVDRLTRSDRSPEAPFAAVELEVQHQAGTVAAGLSTPDDDHVLATHTAADRTVTIEVRVAGRTRVVRRRRVDLRAPYTLGFVVCENQVTVLARAPGGTWRPLLTERRRVADRLDLRRPGTLERFRWTWGARSGTATLGELRAGLYGMAGLRDPHVVQHADGRPFVRDGLAYLTWTCAGLGSFRQAHWGVFTLDLDDPTRLEQVAQLFTRRDGLLLGDHAGQLVRDGDHWLVATSSWGDFDAGSGVHVRHLTTEADLLSGVHLLETERTDLPTAYDAWDPGFTRVDGRWFLGFVASPSQRPFDFHPALASTTAESPWTGLTAVGAAEGLHQCEGPVIARVGEDWWLLASDGDARDYPVFDLSMQRAGRLDAPYPTNIPHPQLIRRDDGSWLLVTFDGTQRGARTMGYGGHGDVVVMTDRSALSHGDVVTPAGETVSGGRRNDHKPRVPGLRRV
jgi:hypothetical protein